MSRHHDAQVSPLRENNVVYEPGLSNIREPVISSHFMHDIVNSDALHCYDDDAFRTKALTIDSAAVFGRMIPSLVNACTAFSKDRAECAKHRARENYRAYGLGDTRQVGFPQFIAEVMFDPQYVRRTRQKCSRALVCGRVKERMKAGSPIEMVIPALPFKFSSPLKTRGRSPDLAEVNFMLGLYEVAATIELIYREARPDLEGRLAGFWVVSDGSRFNQLVGEPDHALEEYRAHLERWIERLGIKGYVAILDYCDLLRKQLPAAAKEAKSAMAHKAHLEYDKTMWPIFDPKDMASTIEIAATVEPDPEHSHPEGRFVPLLKSLVHTINYKTLQGLERLPAGEYRAIYRELVAHIFEPYAADSPAQVVPPRSQAHLIVELSLTNAVKEGLRQAMLREVWGATIAYMAEIKSSRDLSDDPIMTCFPTHFRWTIHAKPGQFAIRTPTAFGISVQAWAGAAVFKLTRDNKIKLCTLPILALEGAGAIPVRVSGFDNSLSTADQPLFYISPDVVFSDINEFLSLIAKLLVRKRSG